MIQGYQAERLRFGTFELNVRTNELLKNGRRVRLQDQPARLLALLVCHPGELVTRSDIQRALWGDDQFVEFDHAINTAMRKIREVLEDDSDHPRMIETLPRKGYRFIASVEEAYRTDSAAATALTTSPTEADLSTPDFQSNKSGSSDNAGLPQAKPADDFVLPARLATSVFLFIQAGYLAMYCAVLYHFGSLDASLTAVGFIPGPVTLPAVLMLSMCGIAVRLYLLSSVGFGHPAAGLKFKRLFPFILVLDSLWAASPLLVVRQIGIGVALAGVAGFAYLPFSQRTLIQSIYPAAFTRK